MNQEPLPAQGPVDVNVRPRGWMAMAYGVPAQCTTDEPTAIRWQNAGGDVRELYDRDAISTSAIDARDAARFRWLMDQPMYPTWKAVAAAREVQSRVKLIDELMTRGSGS